jgi:hypothetical protein
VTPPQDRRQPRKGGKGKRRPQSQQRGRSGQAAPKRAAAQARDTQITEIPDKILYYALHVMVFILPMLFGQVSYDQFDIIKVVTLRAFVLLMLVVWAWRMLMTRKAVIRRGPIDWVILAFLAWVLISTIFSVHVPTALFGKYRRYEGFISLLTYGTLFFLTTQVLTSFNQVRSLMRTTLVSAGIISAYGVLQAVGWDFLTWGQLPFDANRAFSTFGNPDLLAGYVALMMPIALVSFVAQDSDPQDEMLAIGLALIIAAAAVLGLLGLYFKWSPSLMRLVQVVLGLVSVVGLLLPYLMRFIDVLSDRQPREGHFVTLYAVASLLIGIATVTAFARSAWVAGGVSIICIVVMLWRHKFLMNRKTITLAIVIVLAVGSIAVATSREESGVKNLVARVQSIFQFGEGSAKSRFSIWRSAMAATAARPLNGFGPDTFRLVFPRFKEAQYTQQVGRLSVADNVHNYPLQLAATLGIPGSLLFYAVMFSGIYWGWRAAWGKGERSSERTMMGGLVIGLISYQTHLFFGISITGSTFLFWVIMAMALLPWVKSTPIAWREASTAARTAGFGATAAVVATLFILNVRYFQADQFYLRSYQYATVNVDEAIRQARTAYSLNPSNDMYIGQIGLLQSQKARSTGLRADGEAAIVDIRRAIAFNPWEYDNYIFLANAYAILGDADPRYWPDVIEAGAQALRVEPVAPAARFYRGLAYLSMKRYSDAKKELEIGYFQDPSYGEVSFTLGQVYEAMGDKKNARKFYELAKTSLPMPQQADDAIRRLAATSSPTT